MTTPVRDVSEPSDALERRLRFILRAGDFPALSNMVAETMSISLDNATSSQRLANLVLRDYSLTVKVIRSKDIGIIGVGEGSTAPLTTFLHGYLDADIRTLVPSWPEKRWPVTVRQLLGHLGGVTHYGRFGPSHDDGHGGRRHEPQLGLGAKLKVSSLPNVS